jgi:hypothetical protein
VHLQLARPLCTAEGKGKRDNQVAQGKCCKDPNKLEAKIPQGCGHLQVFKCSAVFSWSFFHVAYSVYARTIMTREQKVLSYHLAAVNCLVLASSKLVCWISCKSFMAKC